MGRMPYVSSNQMLYLITWAVDRILNEVIFLFKVLLVLVEDFRSIIQASFSII